MSNTFTGVLMNYGNGALDELLVSDLQDVVLAVMRTGKTGTLTLKIKVSQNSDNTVELDANVTPNKPAGSVGKALFFPDEEGRLLRQDPRQPALPFREISSEPAKARFREGA